MPTNDERRRSPMVEPSAKKRWADIKPSNNRRQTAKEPFPQTAPWQTPRREK